MKYTLFTLAIATMLVICSCQDPCVGIESEVVGDEFFTVEYRTSGGSNYLQDIYNLANVSVFLDTTGGEDPNPNYERFSPGYANGKFGPFNYTERFVGLASHDINSIFLFGQRFKFDYFLRKDTYGVDTLSVIFALRVDECHHYWQSISYELNGEVLSDYTNQQQAEIVIVE